MVDRFINLKAIHTVPWSVDKNTIRIGQLFNKTTSLLWDCFSVCGLKRLIVIEFLMLFFFQIKILIHFLSFPTLFSQQLDWFDGPYFNKLLTEFQQSNNIYKKRLENVKNYRLYVTNQLF